MSVEVLLISARLQGYSEPNIFLSDTNLQFTCKLNGWHHDDYGEDDDGNDKDDDDS